MAAFHAGGTQHLVGVDTQASPLTFGQKVSALSEQRGGRDLGPGFTIPHSFRNG